MDLMKLKSGTDIRGTAVGDNMQLTDGAVEKITFGFYEYLKKKLGGDSFKIAVGHDSRISAERIKAAIIRVLNACGAVVTDCGLASTPAMFMVNVMTDCDASIQITASHHPYDRNGIKFFTKEGGFEGEEIAEVLTIASAQTTVATEIRAVKTLDFMSMYSAMLRDKIKQGVNAEDFEKPLSGFHFVVDAGNGAGGFFANDVLAPLGADVSGSQFLEPDGMFPNHIPNPENETAMGFVCDAAVRNNADLGIIFDTDVDRAGCVTCDGAEINKNRLVALASYIALEGNEGGTVVTDSVTSTGLKKFIENNLGGKHLRFRRGYRNVINKAIELNKAGINSPLAIETSGHAALRENYFLDDGAYLIVKIIILLAKLRKEGRSLGDFFADFEDAAEEKERRFALPEDNFREYGENLIADFTEFVKTLDFVTPETENYEGYRVNFDENNGSGWTMLRLSVHDPVLSVAMESSVRGGIETMEKVVNPFLAKYFN